jgi:hypothetical protein
MAKSLFPRSRQLSMRAPWFAGKGAGAVQTPCPRALIRIAVGLIISLCVGCRPLGAASTTSSGQVFPVTYVVPSGTPPTAVPGPVSGWITDTNGNPIAGASVIPEVLTPGVPLAQIAYGSDSNGYYSLGALLPADYRITIRAEGYLSVTKQVTLKEGQSLILNFALQPNP